MKQATLLLAVLASLPLAACAMAPGDGTEEQSSSTTEPLWIYIRNPAPTVIDFDTDPNGVAIANGATVDASYAIKGVNLTCLACTYQHAFARSPGRTGNGVSLFPYPNAPMFDRRYGAVQAEFTTPRSSVSIDVLEVESPEGLGTTAVRPFFEAYDAAGNRIGPTVYYPSPGTLGFGQWQTLRIDDPNGAIKTVRFSSQYDRNTAPIYGMFDNLTFNTDPYWTNTTPIKIIDPPIKFYPIPVPTIVPPIGP